MQPSDSNVKHLSHMKIIDNGKFVALEIQVILSELPEVSNLMLNTVTSQVICLN